MMSDLFESCVYISDIIPNFRYLSDKNIQVTIAHSFVHILKYPKLALLANWVNPVSFSIDKQTIQSLI